MRRAWMLAVILAGCGDKAVDVTLKLPTSAVSALYDTSCVTAVEIFLDGGNYPTDLSDYTRDCVNLTSPGMTFQQVHDRIHGQFDTKFPATGLSGVELFAYNGRCDAANDRDYDLLFYGSAPYLGNDAMTLDIIPNLSCNAKDYLIRPIDLVKYAKTGNCAASTWSTGKVALSTLSPLPFTNHTYWWGGQATATANGGVVTVHGLADQIGPNSCLATGYYTDDWYEVSCIPPADQRLCSTGGEIEAPLIDITVGYNSEDPGKTNKWGGLVFGVVGSPAPVAGATVTIDPDDAGKGEVVYFDLPAADGNPLVAHAGTSTGTSGLFGVYTMSLVHITVTANGKTAKRLIGGNEGDLGTVFVKL